MKSLSLRALAALLTLLMAGLGLALVLSDPLALQALRHQGFDQYQRWQPRPHQPVPVRIVDIDEASLQRIGQWPWARTRLAQIVERLGEHGAAVIGFDVVLAEADRSSPPLASRDWPLSPGARAELAHLPDHDAVLAQAMAQQPVVLGFAVSQTRPAAGAAPVLANPPYRYVWLGDPAPEVLPAFADAVPLLPPLRAAASGLGSLAFVPDGDGVVRRVPLAMTVAGQPAPSLVAELLRVAQGERNHLLRRAEGEPPALAGVRIGALDLPTTAHGEMWIHYGSMPPDLYVPAWQLLAGEADAALFKDHIVLIGSSAQGLLDLRLNALGQVMPGVEAHAQALAQVLTGQHLLRPSWTVAAEAVLVVLGCAALVLIGLFLPALWAATSFLLLLAGLLWGGWWAFSSQRLLIDSFTPALAWGLSFAIASLSRHFWSERQQRWVKQAFSRYVSPNRVEHLMHNPGQLQLGGHRQHCSFVFTDLAGFTTLMESIDPAEAVHLLNRYLEEMIAIAFGYQGTLDRIMGDALSIMFSAPVVQPDHEQRALDCALDMHAFASRYAREVQARGIAFGHTRIGVHSGEVIVGNFGGQVIFDYRALGDPVNTAARLESVNKQLGTRICVSEATLKACKPSRVRPVGRLVLMGKTEALQVYEPLDEPPLASYAPEAAYRAAYEALSAPDAALARQAFEDLQAAYPADPLVRLHATRLQAGEAGDLIVLSSK